MRPHEFLGEAQQLVQGLPGLAPDMGLAGEQDELLACQQPFEATFGPAQLLLAHLVERLQQMPDDMELVVEDHGLWAMAPYAVDEPFPHVHDRMGDPGSLALGRTPSRRT